MYPVFAVSKMSRIMVNKSGESGYPCLVVCLEGKEFSLLQFTHTKYDFSC